MNSNVKAFLVACRDPENANICLAFLHSAQMELLCDESLSEYVGKLADAYDKLSEDDLIEAMEQIENWSVADDYWERWLKWQESSS